jgi:adenine-specific DNA-methyltransferase
VLGAIESGVDFEKRIADIYQRCRRPEDIQVAFDQLQMELSSQIDESMTRTRQQLLENFDDEVREKLRIRDEDSRAYLNRYEQLLMQLTRFELDGNAEFLNDSSFLLKSCPFRGAIPLGLYELPRRSGEAHLYRLNHPLAEAVLAQAKGRELRVSEILFEYGRHAGKVSALKPLIGRSGWLRLCVYTVSALDQTEDYLIFAGLTDDGAILDGESSSRLMTLPGRVVCETILDSSVVPLLESLIEERKATIQRNVSERNARFFQAEAEKLDGWADDLKVGLEREIKELDRQIGETRRAASAAMILEEKLARQKEIKSLEGQRSQKRRSLFDAQDEIDRQREDLIKQIEGKLTQEQTSRGVFTIRWRIR